MTTTGMLTSSDVAASCPCGTTSPVVGGSGVGAPDCRRVHGGRSQVVVVYDDLAFGLEGRKNDPMGRPEYEQEGAIS